MVLNGDLVKHNAGVYFQKITTDGVTGLSAIPYNKAEDEGFIKIDMLHLSYLNYFNNKDELRKLLQTEPNWDVLKRKENVKKCFQIGNHYDTVKRVNPSSIQDLADIIALIRPIKIRLLDKYIKDKQSVANLLYKKTDKSDIRKSHAIPYAMIIATQLHLIEAGIL
jgi:DNA polymerase III alpha subunit